jgi:hypothetical protein
MAMTEEIAVPCGLLTTVRAVMPDSRDASERNCGADDAQQIRTTKFLRRATEAELTEAREAMLASGVVSRMAVADGLVDLATLKADPLWEQDFITDNWIRRTPEFFAARAIAEEALPGQREAAEIALHLTLLELAKDLPPQEDGPSFAYVPNVGGYHEVCSFDMNASLSVSAIEDGRHRTSGEAIAEWRRRMLVFATQYSGDTLWWRERPEICGRVFFGHAEATWRVYSRLLIGNVADTLIERIKRGEIAPRTEMVKDHAVTLEALVVVGYSYNAVTNEWSRPGWRYDAHADRWREL